MKWWGWVMIGVFVVVAAVALAVGQSKPHRSDAQKRTAAACAESTRAVEDYGSRTRPLASVEADLRDAVATERVAAVEDPRDDLLLNHIQGVEDELAGDSGGVDFLQYLAEDCAHQ